MRRFLLGAVAASLIIAGPAVAAIAAIRKPNWSFQMLGDEAG